MAYSIIPKKKSGIEGWGYGV